jgi:hypothetical protein
MLSIVELKENHRVEQSRTEILGYILQWLALCMQDGDLRNLALETGSSSGAMSPSLNLITAGSEKMT